MSTMTVRLPESLHDQLKLASRKDFESVLNKVPDVQADEADRL